MFRQSILGVLLCTIAMASEGNQSQLKLFSVENGTGGGHIVRVTDESKLGLGTYKHLRLTGWPTEASRLAADPRVHEAIRLQEWQAKIISGSVKEMRNKKNAGQRELIQNARTKSDTGGKLRKLEMDFKRQSLQLICDVLTEEQELAFRNIWFSSLLRARGGELLLESKYIRELELSPEEVQKLRASSANVKIQLVDWSIRHLALDTERELLEVLSDEQVATIKRHIDDNSLLNYVERSDQ